MYSHVPQRQKSCINWKECNILAWKQYQDLYLVFTCMYEISTLEGHVWEYKQTVMHLCMPRIKTNRTVTDISYTNSQKHEEIL
jgi:hypothetical protein